jgi:hypothetical protein
MADHATSARTLVLVTCLFDVAGYAAMEVAISEVSGKGMTRGMWHL